MNYYIDAANTDILSLKYMFLFVQTVYCQVFNVLENEVRY